MLKTENKETKALNNTLDQIYITDIFRTFQASAEEHTSFSSAHGTLLRTDHIVGHKSNVSKFKKTEICINHIF